jgi:hypothetical protein
MRLGGSKELVDQRPCQRCRLTDARHSGGDADAIHSEEQEAAECLTHRLDDFCRDPPRLMRQFPRATVRAASPRWPQFAVVLCLQGMQKNANVEIRPECDVARLMSVMSHGLFLGTLGTPLFVS